MLITVRTTLILDDALLRQAKRHAAERDMTVSQVVNDALRESFDRPAPPVVPFSLITYGQSQEQVQHEPADFTLVLEDEDLNGLR